MGTLQKQTVIKSTITAVTVYNDRALIKRSADLKLIAGPHKLVFESLPPGMESESIQVSGEGPAILKDIQFKQEHYSEVPDDELNGLLNSKKDLENKIRVIDDSRALSQKEKVYIDGILQKLIQPSKKPLQEDNDPENWINIMKFYREKQESLDKELRQSEISKQDLEAGLNKLIRDIQTFSSRRSRTRNVVEVLVDMKKEGELKLNLSYIVYGASWHPVYDIRVSSVDKTLTLNYNALVQQNTSENWEDVELSLSTAQVQIHGKQPELGAWYLDIWKPTPPPPMAMMRSGASAPRKKMAKVKEIPSEREEEEMDVFAMEAPEPAVEAPQVQVETKASSVEFHIEAANTIINDNSAHKVAVMTQTLPARFQYSSVPKLSPHAFLGAIVTNDTDYPLLAGETHIFMDNAMVANASLDTIASGEEFKTSLGVDDSIKVEYKFLKKYEKNEGLIGRKSRTLYDYIIRLTNLKKTEEKITIQDQIPISRHQDIEVKLLEPAYKQDTDSLKKKELDILEWSLVLKPGEKKEIPLSFAVDAPKDVKIEGLM